MSLVASLEVTTQEMQIQSFATIPAIRSKQFGREIFSAMLKFKELNVFLHVFPEVQRGANNRKIKSIKRYILDWLDNPHEMRFFSALTATTRGAVFYDEELKRVAIDVNNSQLSVNDGQHRLFAINAAIEELREKENKSTNPENVEIYKNKRLTLEEMSVTVVIFNQMTEKDEKQLFHDINNLLTRPSRNSNIRLSQNDLWSQLSMNLVETHPYLMKYGVEINKALIAGNNPNTILLSTVFVMARNLFYPELKADSDFLNATNYDNISSEVFKQFTQIFNALPQDINTRHKYVLQKSFALRAVATFVRECFGDITIEKEDVYKAIANVNWLDDIEYWIHFGALSAKSKTVCFPNNGAGGETGVLKACFAELEKIINPK